MKIVVLGTKARLEELLKNSTESNLTTIRVETPQELLVHDEAEAFFDLEFENNADRKEQLKQLSKPIFINSVNQTLSENDNSFIRINGWSTFLNRPILEASCKNETIKIAAEKIAAALNKTIEWVPDVRGFVSARVVSMIVNEAYFALQENVSTKAEIDIAMKLGTNYPFGPFEWSGKIGLKNIYTLLVELTKTNSRYQPAKLLEKEAIQ
jgi:3-hydroxybutyryl-CoA dehydrogenase